MSAYIGGCNHVRGSDYIREDDKVGTSQLQKGQIT